MSRKEYFRHSAAVTRSKRWPVLRQQALRRDDYKCVKCESRQRLQIDHIKPVRNAPELSYELENLQTLCVRCHSSKTREEVGRPLSPERVQWKHLVMRT